MLARLECFANEAPDELEKTWGRLALDDATSEMILLLCGKEVLCDYVSRQNLSDEVRGNIAARVLEVAAFSGDLSGAILSGVHLSRCRLRGCDLSGANLSGSTWNGGIIELVTFDGASLRDSSFDEVRLDDVTFRGADLLNARLNVQFMINVIGGVWCAHGGEETLLVVLADGRLIAFSPRAPHVRALAYPGAKTEAKTGDQLAEWLLGLSGDADLPSLGRVSFTRSGWRRTGLWTMPEIAEGLKAEFNTEIHAGGDVEVLKIKVMAKATGEELLTHHVVDATDVGSQGTRVMALSKCGKHIAVVTGDSSKSQETAALHSRQRKAVPLHGFMGGYIRRGTRDDRQTRGCLQPKCVATRGSRAL
jgi:hypothetical protein